MFKEMKIDRSYYSDEGNLAKEFVEPVLSNSIQYDRCAGYFSSSMLLSISKGMDKFVEKSGVMRLICSIELSREDAIAIESGYRIKSEAIDKNIKDLLGNLQENDIDNLYRLSLLIAKGHLDIKVAVGSNLGLFHMKKGVFTDNSGNSIMFNGSMNETYNAFNKNIEEIMIFKSWEYDGSTLIGQQNTWFNKLWNGKNNEINIYSAKEAVRENIINFIKKVRPNYNFHNDLKKTINNQHVKLRNYQEDAIELWKENKYMGFFEMATGTGKTLTTIFGMKELAERIKTNITFIVVAPYKHLISQWAKDVYQQMPNAFTLKVFSDNKSWRDDIFIPKNLNMKVSKNGKRQNVLLVTNKTFKGNEFQSILSEFKTPICLVVDEAHNFGKIFKNINGDLYKFRLGLSASPIISGSFDKTEEMFEFFRGNSKNFIYNLEDAIRDGHLVKYNYHPLFINLTNEEEEEYNSINKKIASCLAPNGKAKAGMEKALNANYGARKMLLGRAENKLNDFYKLLDNVESKKRLIIYCGSGGNYGEYGNRHVNEISKLITDLGISSHEFTANVKNKDRMKLIREFENGVMDCLVAIKCLDEGVDIPSILNALIISSGSSQREFVQRRGRILRKSKVTSKAFANLYDVIILTTNPNKSLGKSELLRYKEYNSLAMNKNHNFNTFNKLLKFNGLTEADLKFTHEHESEDDNYD